MERNEIAEVFRRYEGGSEPQILDEWLDDWLRPFCDDPNIYSTLAAPVRHFFAAREVQYQVGNGGFAQAAHNVPGLLNDARDCQIAIGNDGAADLIARAIDLVKQGASQFESKEIGALFTEFTESEFTKLDAELDAVNWWSVAERVRYAASHKACFLDL